MQVNITENNFLLMIEQATVLSMEFGFDYHQLKINHGKKTCILNSATTEGA